MKIYKTLVYFKNFYGAATWKRQEIALKKKQTGFIFYFKLVLYLHMHVDLHYYK